MGRITRQEFDRVRDEREGLRRQCYQLRDELDKVWSERCQFWARVAMLEFELGVLRQERDYLQRQLETYDRAQRARDLVRGDAESMELTP